MKNCLKVAIFALAIFALSACNSSISGVDLNVDGSLLPNGVNISYTKTDDGKYSFQAGYVDGRLRYTWNFGGKVYEPAQKSVHNPVISYVDDGDYYVQLTLEVNGVEVKSNVLEISHYQPVKVVTNSNVLVAGENGSGWKYFVTAVTNKKLYHWGTGHGPTATYFNLDNELIKDVAQTHDSIVVLTYSGKVYTYGYNTYGTLGDGTNQTRKSFKIVDTLKDVIVKRIYTNYSSVYAIDSNGRVWSWGRNNNGQLGIGNKNNTYVPTQLKGFDNDTIVDLAVGEYSVYARTLNGEVYSWGDNANGQLGINNYDTKTSPVKVTAFGDKVIVGVSVNSHDSSANVHYHTAFAIDSDGKLYGWGANTKNNLGSPAPANTNIPSLIEGMKDKVVVSVAQTNLGAVFALDDKGNVYSWGSNDSGVLGRSVMSGVADGTPKILNYFSDKGVIVKKVVAEKKTSSVYAYDNNGNAYGWGKNDFRQLGLNSSVVSYNAPVLIESLSGNNIVSMTNGYRVTFAVSDTGKIFGAGENLNYMGVGSYSQENVDPFLHIHTVPAIK